MHLPQHIERGFDARPHERPRVLAHDADDFERVGHDVSLWVLQAGEQDGPEGVDEREEGGFVLG